MKINGFEQIKKHAQREKDRIGEKVFLSFHKMRDGTPFAIICSRTEVEAFYYNKRIIEGLGLALFNIREHADGYKYISLHSIRSKYTHLGVGRAMLGVLKHHAIQNDCKYITLTSVKNAEKFYERLGFYQSGITGELKDYSYNLNRISKKIHTNA